MVEPGLLSQYSDRIQTGHVAGAVVQAASYPMRTGVILPGDKAADHSLPTSAEVNNGSHYTSSPPTPLWGGAQLNLSATYRFFTKKKETSKNGYKI
jgi:hypothetical protein